MFEQTLLDSSPLRVPVLKKSHLVASVLSGALGSAVVFLAWPMFLLRPETKVLVAQSTLAGIVFALSGLMLCYVGADARHRGLKVWVWMGLTLVFNLLGFFAYLLYSAAKTGIWRRATVPAAYCFEVLLVGGLVLMPLISTEALPKLSYTIVLSPRLPPPAALRATPPAVKAVRRATLIDPRVAPVVIPTTVTQFHEEPTPPSLESSVGAGGVPDGVDTGVPNSVLNGLGVNVPPPPPQKPTKILRVRPGGQVEPPKLIIQPQPEYPQLASRARIEGAVRLEAVISRDGAVEALRVVNGHPLLVKAAFDAVSRWRYQPTLLNGEPVEVVMEFEVIFKLNSER